jgi:serine/threonine protein kinase
LEKRLANYRGDASAALRSIRPLVAVLAELPSHKFVHRDFKPENIFIGREENLVLGDAGLAFYMGDSARPTKTYESVGTQHYMPAWAYGRRLKQIAPTFDVFSVGKVIWAMVAGEPACPLWYIHEEDWDLEQRFKGTESMFFVNRLLDKCVVQHEKDMQVQDGNALLREIDLTINAIENGNTSPLRAREGRGKCRACGIGAYNRMYRKASTRNFCPG